MKKLLRHIRLTGLYVFLYNLTLFLSVWLDKVTSKEGFLIAIAGNAVLIGIAFVHLHNHVSDEFHQRIKDEEEYQTIN